MTEIVTHLSQLNTYHPLLTFSNFAFVHNSHKYIKLMTKQKHFCNYVLSNLVLTTELDSLVQFIKL